MADAAAQLQAQLRQAIERGQSVRIAGSGSYSQHCPVTEADAVLSTAQHTGIIDYDPTEMVVRVRSGTPLLELEQTLAEQGQQLGVECPMLSPAATIGGAVAMGMSGSARPFRGAMRDFVLGARILNGLGEDLQFGGQVMKNVAGYDLSRLLVGSRGGLGVLLDLSLRVMPRPEQTLSLCFQQDEFHPAVEFADNLLVSAQPLTGVSFHRQHLFLRFAGREATMAQIKADIGGDAFSDSWWQDLREWKMPWGQPRYRSYRDMRFREPQARGDWLADWNGGLIWSAEPEPTATAMVQLAQPVHGSDLLGQLEQRLRRAFDPHGVFAGSWA